MNRTQYDDYCAAVGAALAHGPIHSTLTDDDSYEFSWRPCECCERPLGGERYPATHLINGEAYELQICGDCVYYLEYGQLDDQTMIDLDDASGDPPF
jgi:hypothetical protein